jgi:hypothetical protein
MLWLPVFVAMLVLVIDATTLYFMHTEMSVVARDAARRLTTGQLRNSQEAEDYVASALAVRELPFTVDVVYDPLNSMEVAITRTYGDMSITGFSTLTIFGRDLTARASMRSAPLLASASGSGGGAGGSTGGGNGN